jgi:hypothetical protein
MLDNSLGVPIFHSGSNLVPLFRELYVELAKLCLLLLREVVRRDEIPVSLKNLLIRPQQAIGVPERQLFPIVQDHVWHHSLLRTVQFCLGIFLRILLRQIPHHLLHLCLATDYITDRNVSASAASARFRGWGDCQGGRNPGVGGLRSTLLLMPGLPVKIVALLAPLTMQFLILSLQLVPFLEDVLLVF